MLKKLIREPLIHFVLIGVSLFFLFSIFSEEERDNQIIIDEYDINEIVSKWRLQWQREPSPQEMKGLMDSYIKQEILYREALALNLDHNDEIIKRRMAQKMKFLTEDLLEVVEPSDAELKEYFNKNKEKYRKESEYSFSQLYFNPDAREEPFKDAKSELTKANPKGDKSSIQEEFENYSLFQIRRVLGKTFTDSLITYEVNEEMWQGPVVSGLGVHLIKISEVKEGDIPEFKSIRNKLKDDYVYHYQQEFNEDLMNSLIEKYEVVFDLENDSLFQE